MAVPRTSSQDEINTAIDRLGAGFGSKQRYIEMSMGRAQDILRAAVHELIELRSESRNYICTKCKQTWAKPPNVIDPTCPVCETLLRPEAVIMRAALENRIAVLEDKVSHLEDSLVTLLDLS